MADVFTKKKRSQVMAAIRSRGNKDTEVKLAAILRASGITGWRRHQALPGRPDFAFRRERLAIFVDGCFWHGCPKHGRKPTSNRTYWLPKLRRNRERDAAAKRAGQATVLGNSFLRSMQARTKSDPSVHQALQLQHRQPQPALGP